MDEQKNTSNNDEGQQSLESLDAPETEVNDTTTPENQSGASEPTLAAPSPDDELAKPSDESPDNAPKPPKRQLRWLHGANLYLIGFVVLVLVAIAVVVFTYLHSNKTNQAGQISSQNLSVDALKQLASSNTNVGNSNQLLTVQSNAIFAGQVLAQKSLEIAGDLKVGGTLSLPSIVVAGASQFGSTQINQDLSVAGKAAIQGALSVGSSLNVNGGGNFNGTLSAPQITANSLQLNGDLVLTHHVEAGGGTPGIARGSAVGSGGSASLSGSDTAGSISIGTGGNPAAGCFATINFTQSFHATPHIVVTPVGASAGGLAWYINRSTTGFSICDASPPPAYAQFGFDYIAFD